MEMFDGIFIALSLQFAVILAMKRAEIILTNTNVGLPYFI